MRCECYRIGGPFIAEDPNCPIHGYEAQAREKEERAYRESEEEKQNELLARIIALEEKIDAMPQCTQPAPSEKDEPIRKAWARFSNALHRSPDAPYPGMSEAFEKHFSQSFTDREWRAESATWAAAWKAAKRHEAQAQPAPEVLSDLTSLLREATDILKWYGNGLHIKRLSGRIDWDAERAKLSRENFEYSFEAYDGTEYYVEDGSRACQLVDKLENALDLAGNINNAQPDSGAQPAQGVPDIDYLVDTLSEFADHHVEHGRMSFDKWTPRSAVEAMLAAAPEAKP